VAGVTYNWENSDTNYKNGVDSHRDWALSQLLSPRTGFQPTEAVSQSAPVNDN
jgi:hypothetical protein